MIKGRDFDPQFDKNEVYELVTTHDSVDQEGYVARIPTKNTLDDEITVTIGAYASSIDEKIFRSASRRPKPVANWQRYTLTPRP